ncbi:MAG: hypothetical protein RIR00_1664 [Pseudomonadota bacterium]|jgi:5,10-methenyltetrahydrofolate synthetase
MDDLFENNTLAAQRQAARRALRREKLAAREALDPARHRALSDQVAAQLFRALPLPPGLCLGFCWPIRNEPDLRPALLAWAERGGQLALPMVIAPDAPLEFHRWQPGDALQPDRYGIPTPVSGQRVRPEVLLLPLNAFDAAGYRLGYGGGYFDRSLARYQPRPLAVGIGFELGRVDSILPEPHDQPLDWIVSEAGAWAVRP